MVRDIDFIRVGVVGGGRCYRSRCGGCWSWGGSICCSSRCNSRFWVYTKRLASIQTLFIECSINTSWNTASEASDLVQSCRPPSLELGFTAFLTKTGLLKSSLSSGILWALRCLRHDSMVQVMVPAKGERWALILGTSDNETMMWCFHQVESGSFGGTKCQLAMM